jgi:membrane-associated progesterone receptor component
MSWPFQPAGVYPFAGRECARALALMSTAEADCNDSIDDLGYLEKENLREWTAKFTYKYPIVGRIVSARQTLPQTGPEGGK